MLCPFSLPSLPSFLHFIYPLFSLPFIHLPSLPPSLPTLPLPRPPVPPPPLHPSDHNLTTPSHRHPCNEKPSIVADIGLQLKKAFKTSNLTSSSRLRGKLWRGVDCGLYQFLQSCRGGQRAVGSEVFVFGCFFCDELRDAVCEQRSCIWV